MPVSIPLHLIPIENDGFHLMIKVKINDKNANMILDTGASRTVFDYNLISEFLKIEDTEFQENKCLSSGLGTNSMKSMAFMLDSFLLGDFELKDYQAIVLDLQHVNESYRMLDLPVIHGVLGGDLLNKFKAVIYYKTKKLKLYP